MRVSAAASQQLEVAELMIAMNRYSISYARFLVAATPDNQIVEGRRKATHGLSEDQIALVERETANLDRKFKMIEESYGSDISIWSWPRATLPGCSPTSASFGILHSITPRYRRNSRRSLTSSRQPDGDPDPINAEAAMTLFIAYQLYRYSFTHSLGLVAFSIFDIVVMALIWHEFSLLRRHLPVEYPELYGVQRLPDPPNGVADRAHNDAIPPLSPVRNALGHHT